MRRKVIYVRKDILIHDLSNFPSFHKSGSIRGMKKLHYGQDACLIQSGEWIYKVPEQMYNYYSRIREFLNENNLDGYHLEPYHKSSYHKYENENDLEFKIVRGKDGKLWGIDVYTTPYKPLIGTIELSYRSEIISFEEQRDGQPNVGNISVDERFRNQGFAKILYKKLISELKKDGYKKLFAGLTRNSMYVNNIWDNLKDGEIEVVYDGRIKTIEFMNL